MIIPSVVHYSVSCVYHSVSCMFLRQLCIFDQLCITRSVVHLILAGQLCITRSVAHYSISCELFCQLWITISRLHDDTVSCVSVLGQ